MERLSGPWRAEGEVELFDLTEPLYSGMPVSKREAGVRVDIRTTHEDEGFASSAITLGTHCGTHVDAPYHFFADGLTIDQLPLSLCFGPAVVLDVRAAGMRITADALVRAAELAGGFSPGAFALLWTGWDRMVGTPAMYDHPYLTEDAAAYLVARACLLVAIDAIGVDDSDGGEFPAHALLLRSGIPIVENLRGLDQLGSGVFGCAVVPLRIRGGDASPVRVIAWRAVVPL